MTTEYAGPTTMVTSPTGSVSKSMVDVLGRLVSQQQCESASLCGELDGIVTEYDYVTLTQAIVSDPAYEGVGFQKVTVTDAEDNATVFVSNLAGQRTYMSDPNSGTSTYLYDDNGRTTWVESETGVIRMGYDLLGRMTVRRTFETVAAATALPDWTATPSGYWQSETVWEYVDDALDGPVGALETTVSTSRVDVGATREFETTSTVDVFDEFGRPEKSTVVLPASPEGTTLLGDLSGYAYTTSVSYDPDTGVVTGSTLPPIGGLPEEVVSTGYRLNGMAQTLTLKAPGVTPSWSTAVVTGTSVDGTGLFESRTYGNGVVRSIGWDTVSRTPEVIEASFDYLDGGNPVTAYLQSDVLTRDVAGRVTRIDDQVLSSAQCYLYDGQNRLKSAWTTDDPCGERPEAPETSWLVGDPASAAYAASYATSWEYSDSGKIESIVNLAASGDPLTVSAVTDQFSYTAPQPHAVSGVSDGVASTSYTYDGAGRMDTRTVDDGVGDVTTTFTWDVSSNLVTSVETGGDTFLYLYDGSGQRLLKVNTTKETATAYLGSTEITDADTVVNADLVLNPNDLQGIGFVTATRYYTFGGATVAIRKGDAVFDDSLSLLLGDHQGSASILMPVHLDPTTKAMLPATVTDAQNSTRNAYLPYGATRGGNHLDLEHGWLNQVTDESDTDLIYLNARYYDPVLSRFLSPDPVMDPGDPRTLDPYRYADNNPVKYADPSGLNPSDCQSYPVPSLPWYADKNMKATWYANNASTFTCYSRYSQVQQPESVWEPLTKRNYRIKFDPKTAWNNLKTVAYEMTVADFVRCKEGDGASCGFAIAAVFPWGKASKLPKVANALDSIADAKRAVVGVFKTAAEAIDHTAIPISLKAKPRAVSAAVGNVTDSGTTIIGRYIDGNPGSYDNIAKSQGHSHYSIPDSMHSNLVGEGLDWDANEYFLRVVVGKGDIVRITGISSVKALDTLSDASSLRKEINFLTEQAGYVWASDGTLTLVPG